MNMSWRPIRRVRRQQHAQQQQRAHDDFEQEGVGARRVAAGAFPRLALDQLALQVVSEFAIGVLRVHRVAPRWFEHLSLPQDRR
jgi:hypothetical protein